MNSLKKYNYYIFISTFTRNIIDIYSVIFLYQKDFSLKTIIYIYLLIYFLGTFISELSIRTGNKVGHKYVLILSSIITSITFYIINKSTNIYLISLMLSLSIFTYHPIRHIYGIKLLKNNKQVGISLIYTYIAIFISSYFTISRINILYLTIISLISIIPIIFINNEKSIINNSKPKLSIYKYNFFIFDQFRIIFLLLEPLYLYIISSTIKYVGIFNIIMTVSSIIYMYILSNKIDTRKYYKYINLFLTIILILKLNIISPNLLLVIAFFEGIGVKSNELVSTINLYHTNTPNEEYIILCEKIICLIRTVILSVIYLLPLSLKSILYLLIGGIFILSFTYKKNTLT